MSAILCFSNLFIISHHHHTSYGICTLKMNTKLYYHSLSLSSLSVSNLSHLQLTFSCKHTKIHHLHGWYGILGLCSQQTKGSNQAWYHNKRHTELPVIPVAWFAEHTQIIKSLLYTERHIRYTSTENNKTKKKKMNGYIWLKSLREILIASPGEGCFSHKSSAK